MFSVIIPLYNKAPYIGKAIESVLAQSYQEFEVIIVDDGSTDDGRLIAGKYCTDEKCRLITQKNSGVSVARNHGVAAAGYDYIAFLDADDWWAPDYLENMKQLISQFPDSGLYACSYYIVKKNSLRTARIGVDSHFTKGLINYFKTYSQTGEMPVWTGAAILKKRIFQEENGFKPQLKLGEDFDLWVRLALKYPVAFLNKSLAYYNQDVDVDQRAVVYNKIFSPESHFIFNLGYLEQEENRRADLKQLTDFLRVYALERYRRQGAYLSEVKLEINKVNFKHQRLKYWFIFHFPVWTINLFYGLLNFAKSVIIYIRNKGA